MEVSIKQINEFERELDISIPWESIKEDYNDLAKQYAKLSVKGFRPGKAPLGAIESTFKKEMKHDLASRCSTRFCRKALKDNTIEAGSPLEIIEIQFTKNEHLALKVQFIEMPPFDLPDYYNLNMQSKEEEDQLNEISEKLLGLTTLAVPPLLVENELNYNDPEEGSSNDSEDQKAAEERVKLMLILKKIATQDNIEVDDRDVQERIKLIAQENDVTLEELKEFLWSNGGMSRLSDSLLAEQVLKYIISIQEPEKN